MKNKYDKIELEHMSNLISDYVDNEECNCDMDCKNCENIDECYMKANNRCNSEWAESIDYGGCDSEEEFWEQLFD